MALERAGLLASGELPPWALGSGASGTDTGRSNTSHRSGRDTSRSHASHRSGHSTASTLLACTRSHESAVYGGKVEFGNPVPPLAWERERSKAGSLGETGDSSISPLSTVRSSSSRPVSPPRELVERNLFGRPTEWPAPEGADADGERVAAKLEWRQRVQPRWAFFLGERWW